MACGQGVLQHEQQPLCRARSNHCTRPTSNIARHILSLRDQRVMLDADLAALYGVETKVLVQAIKRNSERFPGDFMFQCVFRSNVTADSGNVTGHSGDRDRGIPAT